VKAEPHDVIIDAHFLYPDAVAAVVVGRRLGIPVVMTARGSDVNIKCENPVMLRWVRWAAANSSALITVSRALADRLAALRVTAPLVEVVRNGVDLEKFSPRDRAVRRKEMSSAKRLVLSVGHLVAAKGHAIAIEAVARLEDTALVVVGTGPERAALEQLARKLGVDSRVTFLGFVPHERMPAVYNAADALVLASANEGMPNVVLESIACGTPVAATNVGGIGEIVRSPAAGVLMAERSADGLRAALERLFAQSIPVEDTRAYAETFGWSQVVDQQLSVYRRVLAAHPRPAAVAKELKAR
jgi:teichuronic acid biosynthesis glycosyltransferase TuaC